MNPDYCTFRLIQTEEQAESETLSFVSAEDVLLACMACGGVSGCSTPYGWSRAALILFKRDIRGKMLCESGEFIGAPGTVVRDTYE